jgi:hypothetical protein
MLLQKKYRGIRLIANHFDNHENRKYIRKNIINFNINFTVIQLL